MEDNKFGGNMNRRRFLARVVELASTLPLAGILVSNFLKSRDYYESNSSKAKLDEKSDVISPFCNMQNDFRNSLEQLYKEYKQAYYNSHIEPYPTIDPKGHVQIDMRTVWRWEEPRNVPDHRVISSWRDYQYSLFEKNNFLISSPLVDASKVRDIAIEKKQAGKIGQGVLNFGVYGAEIGLLLGYEELLAKARDEKVSEMNSDKQITRRSFFKVGAALAGACAAWKVGKYNENKLERGKLKLEKEINEAWDLGDSSAESSFKNYFQIGYKDLINQVRDNAAVSKNTLAENIREERVRDSFQNVAEQAEHYVSKLEEFFSDGVPSDLGFIARCGSITKKLAQISSDEKIYASSGILLEGLAVGGIMAAVLLPAEIINNYFE